MKNEREDWLTGEQYFSNVSKILRAEADMVSWSLVQVLGLGETGWMVIWLRGENRFNLDVDAERNLFRDGLPYGNRAEAPP